MEADIDFFQWSTTETEYEANYKALVDKYTKEENVVNYTAEEEDALVKFFKCVDDNWGPKTPVHSVLTGEGRGGARPTSIFSTNNDFSHQIRVPRCPVPLVPILKNFLGPLGPIFGSKMGQNGLKCHLWGPDGPKCLEQGGTRLEQGTGYKD